MRNLNALARPHKECTAKCLLGTILIAEGSLMYHLRFFTHLRVFTFVGPTFPTRPKPHGVSAPAMFKEVFLATHENVSGLLSVEGHCAPLTK